MGLCPHHKGDASAHVVVALSFLLAFLHRTALFLLLPDTTLVGPVPLDPSSVTAGRDRHVQRQFCSQVGLSDTCVMLLFILTQQRKPRKLDP